MLPEKPWVNSARLPAFVRTGFEYAFRVVPVSAVDATVFRVIVFIFYFPELLNNFLRTPANPSRPDAKRNRIEGSGTSVTASVSAIN